MARKILFVALLSLGPGQLFAASNMTLEFHDAETRPKRILIMPVQANLHIDRVGENEPVVAESASWELATITNIKETLLERGYEPMVIDAEQLSNDPQLRELVNEVNGDLDEYSAQIRPRDVVERRYNLGSGVRSLAKHGEADAVLIARVRASAKGGGAAFMSAMVGGAPSISLMSAFVLDGATGDVEALFSGNGGSVSIDQLKGADEKKIAKMVKKTFKKYPKADADVKINERTKKRAVAKTVSGDDDEEMLSELEGLLDDS
jgi:hypothetical protein